MFKDLLYKPGTHISTVRDMKESFTGFFWRARKMATRIIKEDYIF